jgi:hypothetical protein
MNSQSLKDAAREIQARMNAEATREVVAKSRWTCESNWMMAMVYSSGWDVANQMNVQVGQAVGKAEMHRLMRVLEVERPKNVLEFMTLVTLGMETFITKDYFDYELRCLSPGKMLGVVRKCYAFTQVKRLGVENDYQCGCFGMRAGWYQAMGLDLKENLVKCLKNGAEQCEIMLENVIFPET